jgi:hypothetical protein
MFKSVGAVETAVIEEFFEAPWSDNPLAGI